jgi:hypothetical protein
MTVSSSKVVAYGMTGANGARVSCSKLVAYAWMEPGTEGGGTPPTRRGLTYAQTLRRTT